MLVYVLFFIIISLLLQIPVQKWRSPYVASTFVVFIFLIATKNVVDAIVLFVWYVFLVSDYGRMFVTFESFDTRSTVMKTISDSQSAAYKKAVFDSDFETQMETLYDLKYPSYKYNEDTDKWTTL